MVNVHRSSLRRRSRRATLVSIYSLNLAVSSVRFLRAPSFPSEERIVLWLALCEISVIIINSFTGFFLMPTLNIIRYYNSLNLYY